VGVALGVVLEDEGVDVVTEENEVEEAVS